MNEKPVLSAEEKEALGEKYLILSQFIAYGCKTDRFCDSAKEIAQEFVPMSDDERAAKLAELKEYEPVTPTRLQLSRRGYEMFNNYDYWGTRP